MATGRLVEGFLYQVQALDAWTYVGVALALAGIGLTAALLPARKAASIDPMEKPCGTSNTVRHPGQIDLVERRSDGTSCRITFSSF